MSDLRFDGTPITEAELLDICNTRIAQLEAENVKLKLQMEEVDQYLTYDLPRLEAENAKLNSRWGAAKDYYTSMNEADNNGDADGAAMWNDKLAALLEGKE